MTLPASGSLSISQIAAEFGVSLPCVFPDAFYGKAGLPSSGALAMSQFHGLSSVLFTPDGGSIFGDDYQFCSTTIYCTTPAVWTFSGGGVGGFVDVSNGGTASSITFSVTANGSPSKWFTRTLGWSVTGTVGGVSRNFSVTLTAEGDF